MLKVPINEIIEKISEASGLSDAEIKKKIQEKMNSLEGLVSEEGAAHIIAHELGIELFKTSYEKEVKIKELPIGLRKFEIVGVITNVFNVKTFKKQNKTGKVASFILEDETARIRVTLWNEATDLVETGKIAEGKTIKIKNGLVKINKYQGRENKEIHTTSGTKIEFDVEEKIEIHDRTKAPAYEFKNINQTKAGDLVKIRGTVVSVFMPKLYFACPECNKKIEVENEKGICKDHGDVKPKKTALFSFVVDDGTDNIRCVSFRETAESILNMSPEDIEVAQEENINQRILGDEVEIVGRVNENKQSGKKEILLSGVNKNLNPVQIAKSILGDN